MATFYQGEPCRKLSEQGWHSIDLAPRGAELTTDGPIHFAKEESTGYSIARVNSDGTVQFNRWSQAKHI